MIEFEAEIKKWPTKSVFNEQISFFHTINTPRILSNMLAPTLQNLQN